MKRTGFAVLALVVVFIAACTKTPPKSEWYAELRLSGQNMQVILWSGDFASKERKPHYWLTLDSVGGDPVVRQMFESSISVSSQSGRVIIHPNLHTVRIEFDDASWKSLGGDFPVKWITGEPFFHRRQA